ncbi:plasmid pRiA4b ORF-3 family protein [Aquisphaera insulae]|uniref:plasmid pRiA4b ORF-3 family protein n=1 Tax=Aquisphaera insulae TaxID=2712864 RepID=UPI0013EAA842|nr:plasmid pRiA4b ORF-3 family protein [Aquisphaera insulae]
MAQERKLSEILVEMAKVLMKAPERDPSIGALEVATLLANVAWNRAIGLEAGDDTYRDLLATFERESPNLWDEFRSRDVPAMVDALVRYKRAHFPDDGRRILTCGIPEGKVRVEWLQAAQPGLESELEMQLYALIRLGEIEGAIRHVQKTRKLPRNMAAQVVADVVMALAVSPALSPKRTAPPAKKKPARKQPAQPVTKTRFLLDLLAQEAKLDLEEINRRWVKAGHPGVISASLLSRIRQALGISIQRGRSRIPAAIQARAAAGPTKGEPAGAAEVYQLKITLKGTKPPIWRRIQTKNTNLVDLHYQIQAAMGWDNSHLYEFRVGDRHYGEPDVLEEADDASKAKLSDILTQKGQRFSYLYDFGDSWGHEIVFEGRVAAEPGAAYPRCVAGALAGPPEDCGGVWGYYEIVEATGSRRAEIREWLGDDFDPTEFSATDVTRRMQAGRR